MRQAHLFARLLFLSLAVLALVSCARRSAPTYTMIDPATGQQVQSQVYAQPQIYAQQPVQQPVYAQPQYPRQQVQPQIYA